MKKGFTLIEILIVIAIIAILAGIVLVGLGPITKQGRDSRRIQDLKQVQSGLELYFNKNGKYPPAAASWSVFQSSLTTAGIGVNNVPTDPSNTGNYVYVYVTDSNQSIYVLQATLEDANSPSIASGHINVPPGVTVDCTGNHYCVSL